MSCFQPIQAWRVDSGRNPETGLWPVVFSKPEGQYEPIYLPCGKCIGCRSDKAREWAIRCVHEASLYEKNCFITLTYERNPVSLVKEDFVLFMKRLRKKYGIKKEYKDGKCIQTTGTKIRYFQCGEYGENYSRPHHHAALFNWRFEDEKFWRKGFGGDLFISETLNQTWGHGFTTIGELTPESAAYIAGYVVKKLTRDLDYGKLIPEYITMSRNPGIGKEWIKKYWSDVYNYDKLEMKGGLLTRPPRYYDNIFEDQHHSNMLSIKNARQERIKRAIARFPQRLRSREVYKQIEVDRKKNNRNYELNKGE